MEADMDFCAVTPDYWVKWDTSFTWLPLAFNLSYHESSRFTPFELMFRYSPNCPLGNKWNIKEILPDDEIKVRRNWNVVRSNLQKALNKYKKEV